MICGRWMPGLDFIGCVFPNLLVSVRFGVSSSGSFDMFSFGGVSLLQDVRHGPVSFCLRGPLRLSRGVLTMQ